MRSDLTGMPIVLKKDKTIHIIRAAFPEPVPSGTAMTLVLENEDGELRMADISDVRMLVPQTMSSYSATSIVELFPDLLMRFGRREIVAIWTLSLDFDGPLRDRIHYGILAFEEGKSGELAAMRAMRDAGMVGDSDEGITRSQLKAELRAEILAELAASRPPGES